MPEWIDVLVYAAFIVMIWGWLPAWSHRLAMPAILERNPDWVAQNPDVARRIATSRWLQVSCLSWGALSLFVLLALQAGVGRELLVPAGGSGWEALKDLNSTLFITGLIVLGGCAFVCYRRLYANIPLPSRRQASLERRSIHAHVPRALQYAVAAAVILHLAAWVMVGLTGRYSSSTFWGDLIFQFVISGVVLALVSIAVLRKPGTMDRVFGPAYRRAEVRVAFVAQLLPLFNGVARLYEQVAGVRPEQIDRLSHLALVLLVTMMGVTFGIWSRRDNDPRAPWLPSARPGGVLR